MASAHREVSRRPCTYWHNWSMIYEKPICLGDQSNNKQYCYQTNKMSPQRRAINVNTNGSTHFLFRCCFPVLRSIRADEQQITSLTPRLEQRWRFCRPVSSLRTKRRCWPTRPNSTRRATPRCWSPAGWYIATPKIGAGRRPCFTASSWSCWSCLRSRWRYGRFAARSTTYPPIHGPPVRPLRQLRPLRQPTTRPSSLTPRRQMSKSCPCDSLRSCRPTTSQWRKVTRYRLGSRRPTTVGF